MSCAGRAVLGDHRFELPPEVAERLLQEAATALTRRLYQPEPITVATTDRAAIERLLPADLPQKGGGAGRLRQILFDEFLALVRDYRHPLHLGHQRPAPSFASLYADLAAAAFNPTVTMFEGGPYSVAVEGRVLDWMKRLVGYPADAVATMVNGGAEANLTALLVARDRALAEGPAPADLRLLIGQQAHYTLARCRHILGLSPQALVTIPGRADLSLDMDALATELTALDRAGKKVMAIVANAGCTANGAFDDLGRMAELAAAAGTWLHVDAAHGGAALLSDRQRHKLRGIDRADSIVINPHKMFFVATPCSVLLCRHRAEFAASLDVGLETASYVIPDPTTLRAISDGDEPLRWTLACTRFFSAFRLYAALSTYGTDGLGARIDHVCDLAGYLHDEVTGSEDFEGLCRPAFNMVCFRYRPAGIDPAQLDALNRTLRARLASGPDAYLTGCEAQGVYWLRAQIMSEHVDRDSLCDLLPLLRRYAALLTASLKGSAP
ncbi:aspartate aminotransferase family protein [Ferrovibrio sp.]|uniref:pyridoxal phosphate-dependent decarboxylase family protein n=1 Tax=Ferrovibrio sp. TaxID=1917215 RepID=UPI0035B1EA00